MSWVALAPRVRSYDGSNLDSLGVVSLNILGSAHLNADNFNYILEKRNKANVGNSSCSHYTAP